MNTFLWEIHEKYMKIVKSANLIGFLNRLAKMKNLTDSQPLDSDQRFHPPKLEFFWTYENFNLNKFKDLYSP